MGILLLRDTIYNDSDPKTGKVRDDSPLMISLSLCYGHHYLLRTMSVTFPQGKKRRYHNPNCILRKGILLFKKDYTGET